jgi:hypothetical protein
MSLPLSLKSAILDEDEPPATVPELELPPEEDETSDEDELFVPVLELELPPDEDIPVPELLLSESLSSPP